MSNESGVHGHSSAIATDDFVIFTLDDSSPHGLATFKHWLVSHRIPFKPLLGMWHNVAEYPFIVREQNMGAILLSGVVNNQECFLYLGSCDRADRRAAKLVYQDGTPDHDLGRFGEVSESEAKAEGVESWTYDPASRTYFLAKHDWNDAPSMHLGANADKCPACGHKFGQTYVRNGVVRQEARLPGAVKALMTCPS